VIRQTARVVEQRGHVRRPLVAEPGRRRRTEGRSDQLADLVGVAAEGRVGRLGEVLVAPDPPAHHVRRQLGVSTEQRL
jgi:hypothetical protein